MCKEYFSPTLTWGIQLALGSLKFCLLLDFSLRTDHWLFRLIVACFGLSKQQFYMSWIWLTTSEQEVHFGPCANFPSLISFISTLRITWCPTRISIYLSLLVWDRLSGNPSWPPTHYCNQRWSWTANPHAPASRLSTLQAYTTSHHPAPLELVNPEFFIFFNRHCTQSREYAMLSKVEVCRVSVNWASSRSVLYWGKWNFKMILI